jgi:Terminase RNaseH-like domain
MENVLEQLKQTEPQLLQEILQGKHGALIWGRILLPQYFNFDTPEFHTDMIKMYDSYKYVAIAAPRDHAKSTVTSLIYVLFRMCIEKEYYTIVLSDTYDQASEQVGNIYAEIIENNYISKIYPHVAIPNEFRASRKTKKQIKKRQTDFITTGGQRVRAFGVGMKLRGRRHRHKRPTLCICDDLENDEAVDNPELRFKLMNWFKSVIMPAIDTDGQIIVVGTILHRDSLLQNLISGKIPSFRYKFYAAEKDQKPLWENKFSLNTLRKIRSDIGLGLYAREYLNDPTKQDGKFKQEWFDDNRALANPGLCRIVVAVDPSNTGNTDSDECGIIVAGVDQLDNLKESICYVLDDISERLTPSKWARRALETFWAWEADAIVVEVNSGGDMIIETLKSVLLPGEMLPPIVSVRATRGQGKITRLEPVASLYERGRIKHIGEFDKLEDQCLSYRVGKKSPDRMDALVWGITDLVLTVKEYLDLAPVVSNPNSNSFTAD